MIIPGFASRDVLQGHTFPIVVIVIIVIIVFVTGFDVQLFDAARLVAGVEDQPGVIALLVRLQSGQYVGVQF